MIQNYFKSNILSVFKNCTFFSLIVLFSACGDNNYLDRSNADIKDEDGKEVVYHEGKRFTGNLITTYSSKKTVKQMYQLKNGELTGIESSHKGEKTIRHITTMSGQKLRLPVKDEEITKNKEIRYYDSGEVKVEGEGYLEYNSKKQRYVFIKHGKATKYDEDGIVIKEREYVKGERVK